MVLVSSVTTNSIADKPIIPLTDLPELVGVIKSRPEKNYNDESAVNADLKSDFALMTKTAHVKALKHKLIFNSAATSHMTNDVAARINIRGANSVMEMGNENTVKICKYGTLAAPTVLAEDIESVTIGDVAYIPELTVKLLSVNFN